METFNPPSWKRPKGYSNVVAASGRMIFVAGQIGWDEQEVFHTDDLAAQVRQALRNVVTALQEAGAKPEHIVRMTWYLADRKEYLARQHEIGAAYREIIGRHFPVMTAVQVAGFIEAKAQVEIEVTAMLPV